jgi:hypothetical protein
MKPKKLSAIEVKDSVSKGKANCYIQYLACANQQQYLYLHSLKKHKFLIFNNPFNSSVQMAIALCRIRFKTIL